MNGKRFSIAVAPWLVFMASTSSAATFHHQGVVAVQGERFTGQGLFRFALVDPDTDVYLWTSDGSAVAHPDPPTAAVSLTTVNGVYNVLLGDPSVTNMTAIPDSVFAANENVVLRLWFDDGRGNGTHRLTPDVSITASPYAHQARSSERLNIPGTDTAAVTVAGNGNVGIGTDDATNRLTVQGSASISDDLGVGTDAPDNTLTVAGDADFTGNVGIGTTDPSAKLDVEGTTELNGDVTINSNLTVGTDTLFVSGTSGNVGIGVTNPQNRLDVEGGAVIGSVYSGTNIAPSNGLLVQGRVGIGTSSPIAQRLHARGPAASAGVVLPQHHVAYIENTSECSEPCIILNLGGLGIKTSYFNLPGDRDRFITFFGRNNLHVGSIRGNGFSGISFVSGGGDYAEWLPKRDSEETFEPGQIVGIHAGRVSKTLTGADHVSVISTGPIIEGNYPGDALRHTHIPVVFVGQAPVRVRGPVNEGDVVIGTTHDGVGVGVAPSAVPVHQLGRVVGTAWTGSDDDGVKEINVGINLGSSTTGTQVLVAVMEAQNRTIEALQARISAIESRLDNAR
ncbi:MAG: hypothetical protein V3W34_16620 [Phycisphaerae bacterium]